MPVRVSSASAVVPRSRASSALVTRRAGRWRPHPRTALAGTGVALRSGLRQDDLERLVAVAMTEAGDGIAQRYAGGELRRERGRDGAELPDLRIGDLPVDDERAGLQAQLVIVVGHLGRKTELVRERRRRHPARELETED